MATKAALEALLRDRKLDRTLIGHLSAASADEAGSPLALPALDARLLGGLPRGQLSEIAGAASTGRTSLAWAWLSAATRRGESAALIDTFDRFDPASGAAAGIELTRLLWVRGQAISKTGAAVDPAWLPGVRMVSGPGTLVERAVDRALKALNLVLQAGVCTAVVLDLADVPLAGLRRIPASTWLRVQRLLEGGDAACVLLVPLPVARSAGGVTMLTGVSDALAGGVRWAGSHDRARRLAGVSIAARLVSPRRTLCGDVGLEARVDPSI
ncbi:MAG: hypothetical protein AB1635_10010 [Acidobacteriota bacterium]